MHKAGATVTSVWRCYARHGWTRQEPVARMTTTVTVARGRCCRCLGLAGTGTRKREQNEPGLVRSVGGGVGGEASDELQETDEQVEREVQRRRAEQQGGRAGSGTRLTGRLS